MSSMIQTAPKNWVNTACLLNLLGAIALIVSLVAAPLIASNQYYLNVLVLMALNATLATGLAIVVRAGRLSLAQATFSGIGGYTSGLLVMKLGMDYWPALLLAGMFAAVVGVLLGLTSLRLRGFYFAIATFTFSQLVIIILRAWTPVTGGMSGMFGLPVPPDILGISFLNARNYYYLALFAAALSVLASYACSAGTRFGRGLTVLGEDEVLARALGVPATRYRLYAFAISSFIGGVAGSLSAHFIQGISPSDIQPIASVFVVVMVMAGGANMLLGPIVGAVVMTAVPELLRASAQWSMVFYGLFLLAYVFFFQNGLLPLLQKAVYRIFNITVIGPEYSIAAIDRPAAYPTCRTAPVAGNVAHLQFGKMQCNYGNLAVLQEIDWKIENGCINGLIGPNGAGKTTFFNVVTGVAPLSGGRMLWKGEAIVPTPESMARRGVARTFQHARILENHTVFEAISLGAELPGSKPEPARLEWLISKLKLQSIRDVRSGGLTHYQKRLVSIGMAMASDCEVLLLDEPLAGLDDTETEELTQIILDLHQAAHNTVLLIEHKLSVIMRICSHLTVLDQGRIIAQGAPKAVASNEDVIRAYLGDE
jgi:branched-chain amino acid transport system permease protein